MSTKPDYYTKDNTEISSSETFSKEKPRRERRLSAQGYDTRRDDPDVKWY